MSDGPAPEHERPVIPDFELLRPLASGAFGTVWLATSKTGVPRAIKVVSKATLTAIELDGLKAFVALPEGHPNLIDIRHDGETGQDLFYVMELAHGYETARKFSAEDYEPRSLATDLQREERLSLERAIEIAVAVLNALDHLHRHGLVHRDVKPPNILFVGSTPKLGDIGLVRPMTRQGSPRGTPHYAPPEGCIDKTGDFYALGKTLFEMLTGVGPELFPELPPDAPDDVRASVRQLMPVIDRACAPDPKDRFQSADAFRRALARRVRSPQRRRNIASLAGLVGLVVAAASFLAYRGPIDAATRDRTEDAEPLQRRVRGSLTLGYLPSGSKELREFTPHDLPLYTGEAIQLSATFDEPCFPVLFHVTSRGTIDRLYPADGTMQVLRSVLQYPEASLCAELQAPEETHALILLCRRTELSDLDAVETMLRDIGPPVALESDVLELVTDTYCGPLAAPHGGRERSGEFERLVEYEPRFVQKLWPALRDDFAGVWAIVVPQARAH